MDEVDAREASDILQRMLTHLAGIVQPVGPQGSQARTAIGDLMANTLALLRQDLVGPPLDQCFMLTRQTGASLGQFETVRAFTTAETPRTLGGTLIMNAGINECLAQEAMIIAGMTFVSRQDVDQVQSQLIVPFNDAEEVAADSMDSLTFEALIALYAAITNHLVSTARPLPRMVGYQFFKIMPSLVLANRLYADASRADELVAENKIVHPAFCPTAGQALSA